MTNNNPPQIQIHNASGVTNDLEVYFNGKRVEGVVSVSIHSITADDLVTADFRIERVGLGLLQEEET